MYDLAQKNNIKKTALVVSGESAPGSEAFKNSQEDQYLYNNLTSVHHDII